MAMSCSVWWDEALALAGSIHIPRDGQIPVCKEVAAALQASRVQFFSSTIPKEAKVRERSVTAMP